LGGASRCGNLLAFLVSGRETGALAAVHGCARALRNADQVGKFTVFNIAGNAYRLITVIHFNTGRVYVRRVLTHAAYTRGTWRDD
jgi:mRNA-degrading endonuclease HigB of HigAB toxin-antitoxin module